MAQFTLLEVYHNIANVLVSHPELGDKPITLCSHDEMICLGVKMEDETEIACVQLFPDPSVD